MLLVGNTEWPGKGGEEYDGLRRAIDKMNDDDTIGVDVENEDKLEHVRKAGQRYAHNVLNSRSKGWELKTTKRGNTLFFKRTKV
jgi:hypothetical protein